jgi:hypothetical protein
MTSEQALKQFHEKIFNNAEEIDPDHDRDWFDLAFGYFLALEFDIDTALEMADSACTGGV